MRNKKTNYSTRTEASASAVSIQFGLKLNLQHKFFVSRPTTFGDAFSLARIIEARFKDERTTTTIANPNIVVPDEVLEESTLHTSDMIEVVPTSMVATYDEHGESGDGEQDDAIESGSGRVRILINNGRTHTFVQPRVVERMHLPITESTRLDQGEVLEGLQHKQGLLLFRGWYFIGARSKLKEVLLSEFHDTPSVGHGGLKKKIKDEIQRRTWDLGIKKFFRHHLDGNVVVKEWRMIRPLAFKAGVEGALLMDSVVTLGLSFRVLHGRG
ncbi:hypothetical protein Tco_0684425 [Tanacetum coccineum]